MDKLLFSTVTGAAWIHTPDCKMVRTGGKGKVVVSDATEAEVADLTERGYKVVTCKCVKMVGGAK